MSDPNIKIECEEVSTEERYLDLSTGLLIKFEPVDLFADMELATAADTPAPAAVTPAPAAVVTPAPVPAAVTPAPAAVVTPAPVPAADTPVPAADSVAHDLEVNAQETTPMDTSTPQNPVPNSLTTNLQGSTPMDTSTPEDRVLTANLQTSTPMDTSTPEDPVHDSLTGNNTLLYTYSDGNETLQLNPVDAAILNNQPGKSIILKIERLVPVIKSTVIDDDDDDDVIIITDSSDNEEHGTEDHDISCEDDAEMMFSDDDRVVEYEVLTDNSADTSGTEASDTENTPEELFPKVEMVGQTQRGTTVTTRKRLWTDEPKSYQKHKCRGPPPGYTGRCDGQSAVSNYVIEIIGSAIDSLVECTNNNILAKMRREQRKTFQSITTDEMYAYLGALMTMGFNPQPEISSYFSKCGLLGNAAVQTSFSRSRFTQIWNNMSYTETYASDSELRAAEHRDPVSKVRPFLTKMNEKFRALRNPNRELVVDETMTRYKGRSSFKVRMPKKPAKCGFEHFTLVEASSGYVLNDEPHVGRRVKMVFNGEPEPAYTGGVMGRITRFLARHYLGNWYHLIFDNRFTSTKLLEFLYLNHKTTAVGSLRNNSTDMPEDYDTMYQRKVNSVQRGTYDLRQNGRLVMCAWRDKTTLCVLSTGIDPTSPSQTVTRRVRNVHLELNCPAPTNDYVTNYKGVDLANQLSASYRVGRRCMRWHRYFFFHKLNQVLVNAYINWQEVKSRESRAKAFKKPRSQLDFRMCVAKEFLGRHIARFGRPQTQVPMMGRIHSLVKYSRSKRCVICRSKGIRHETRMRCAVCQIHICNPKNRPECLQAHQLAAP
jgi:hypothetical protein